MLPQAAELRRHRSERNGSATSEKEVDLILGDRNVDGNSSSLLKERSISGIFANPNLMSTTIIPFLSGPLS